MELFVAVAGFFHNQKLFDDGNYTDLMLHLKTIIIELSQENMNLLADSKNTNKESENDQHQQRNQQLQTTILTVAMFYAGSLTVVIQAPLPEGTPSEVVLLMSVFGALSFVNILICIALCMELLHRTSEFMVRRAKHYTTVVNHAENELNRLMTLLKNELERFQQEHSAILNGNYGTFMTTGFSFVTRQRQKERITAAIAFVEANKESQLNIKQNLLQEMNHYPFETFWTTYCAQQKMWGDYFCYAGVFCTIIASGIWAFNYYSIVHKNLGAASVFVAILSLSMVVIFIIYKNRINTVKDAILFNNNNNNNNDLPPPLLPLPENMV
jgi:hypothetical protein